LFDGKERKPKPETASRKLSFFKAKKVLPTNNEDKIISVIISK
jgi:hypothetical protein